MEFDIAKEKAVSFMALSKKTKFEIIQKLKKQGADDETAKKVAEYYENLGYIDDKDYVESFIRQNEKMLKYSIFEIKQKLKMKGIKLENYANNFNELKENKYESKVIEKLKNSKLKNMDEEHIRAYLFRRGFMKGDNIYDTYNT